MHGCRYAQGSLGTVNWYLPCWLNWLPDVRIDHEPIVPSPVSSTPDLALRQADESPVQHQHGMHEGWLVPAPCAGLAVI